ncbi:hypothetical protein [Brevibacterium siliguriense]|nr:hypothetical protein [Brevibacterium siliguriense]
MATPEMAEVPEVVVLAAVTAAAPVVEAVPAEAVVECLTARPKSSVIYA